MTEHLAGGFQVGGLGHRDFDRDAVFPIAAYLQ
jgi:hypothetical protein